MERNKKPIFERLEIFKKIVRIKKMNNKEIYNYTFLQNEDGTATANIIKTTNNTFKTKLILNFDNYKQEKNFLDMMLFLNIKQL